jgi:hypothetical protein
MYAAALTRDKIDENIIMEWGSFVPSDIDRGDWINAMIKDHKVAKHTANMLLLYPLVKSHCPRCTQIHDPRHRNFSSETCVVLNGQGPLEMGGFLPCKYIYCATQPMHARKYCPRINLRCFQCLHRGHAEVDKVCCDIKVNLALFRIQQMWDGSPPTAFDRRGLRRVSFPFSPFHRFATLRTREGTRACWPCQYRRRKNSSTREFSFTQSGWAPSPISHKPRLGRGTSWQRTTRSMPRTWGA